MAFRFHAGDAVVIAPAIDRSCLIVFGLRFSFSSPVAAEVGGMTRPEPEPEPIDPFDPTDPIDPSGAAAIVAAAAADRRLRAVDTIDWM